MADDFHIVQAGDAAVIVKFPERVDPAVNARAIGTAAALQGLGLSGIRDIVPTFRTVAVYFDPLRTDFERLVDELRRLAGEGRPEGHPLRTSQELDAEPITVPVKYGGQSGPDLADVARFAGVTQEEVVRLHSETVYRVFMIGFVPGFAYMGSVDQRIAAPRRQTPRTSVPAGSVGIAASQTGVYPSQMPGGWQLIGRTNIRPFDLSRDEVCLFKPGDLVRFVAVDAL